MADVRAFFKLNSDGALTTGALKDQFIMPCAGEVVGVVGVVSTAPTGSSINLDLQDNGVSVYSLGVLTANMTTPTVLSVPLAHGLVIGNSVTLGAVTGIVGLSTATTYYIVAVPNINTFSLSATLGGAAISVTVAGTAASVISTNAQPVIAINAMSSNGAPMANGLIPQPVHPAGCVFKAGDVLQLSINQIGSTVAGANLDMTVEYITY